MAGVPVVGVHLGRVWLVAALGLVLCVSAMVLAPPAKAAFPGRDGRIVFTRADQIYTIRPDGSGLRRLTRSGINHDPKYSPDGTRIAFVHEANGTKDIWVMRAGGARKRQVTRTGTVTTPPSWSRDGRWIVFGSPMQKIRSTAPFGEPLTFMGREAGDEGEPPHVLWVDGTLAWSPDGELIAYYSWDFPSSPDHYILVYDLARQEISEWADVGGECCGEGYYDDLAWSASGDRLGFTSTLHHNSEPEPLPVVTMLMKPEDSTGTSHVPFASVPGDQQPAFSPSGRSVVLMNDAFGLANIYVTRADGSGRRLLTRGSQPDWQPLPWRGLLDQVLPAS